jgi:hypothetical protein
MLLAEFDLLVMRVSFARTGAKLLPSSPSTNFAWPTPSDLELIEALDCPEQHGN